jgi:rRNA maturation protein Rpf1
LILLTTSRRPTGRIRSFCRDLVYSIPQILSINRGKMSLDGIAEKSLEIKADHVIVVDRCRNGFGQINLFQVSSKGLHPVEPIMHLSDICLRRELKVEIRRFRSSVVTVESKTSINLKRAAKHISQFLNLPLMSVDEAIEQHRASLHFMFDSSGYIKATFMILDGMVEIGPRLNVSKLTWEEDA